MIISIWNQNKDDMSSAFQAVLCLAAVYSLPCSISMMESTSGGAVLGDVMIDGHYSRQLHEETVYKTTITPGASIADFVSKRYNRMLKGENTIELINGALYYLPQYVDNRADIYDRILCYDLYSYLCEADSLSDFTVVNTARSESMASVEILNDSDKVIVLMSANFLEFSRFMDRYQSIISKCYFVIFDLINKCSINTNFICHAFGLKPDKIFVLPYTNEFMMYADSGCIGEYFSAFYKCNKACDEYRVMNGFINLADIIFGHGYDGINIRAAELTNIIQRKKMAQRNLNLKMKLDIKRELNLQRYQKMKAEFQSKKLVESNPRGRKTSKHSKRRAD